MVWFLGLYRKKTQRHHQVRNYMVSSFQEEFLMTIQVLSSNFFSCQNELLITHLTMIWYPVFFWRISDENPSLAFKFFQLLKWTSYHTSHNDMVSCFFEEFLIRIHKISELLYFFKETVFHIIVRCVIRCSFLHFISFHISIWNRMKSYESIWKRMKAYQSVWQNMKAYESVWKHMESIWKRLKVYGSVLKRIEAYGSVWKCMKAFRSVWKRMKVYGSVRKCMEAYKSHISPHT